MLVTANTENLSDLPPYTQNMRQVTFLCVNGINIL